MNQRAKIPMIIGLTHVDCENAWSAENIAIALGYGTNTKNHPSMVKVNANESESVIQALMTLLEQLMSSNVA
jgi:uncharacterized protein